MDRPAAPARFTLTHHALDRAQARRLPLQAVRLALSYGRRAWTRGACIYAIGRREVATWRERGVDLAPWEGVQVVTSADGTVLTAYRNRDLRGLRPNKRPRYLLMAAAECHEEVAA